MAKAKLYIENIGGFRKSLLIEFSRRHMYFVEGSNSSGKTSLIKALTGILSVPQSGQYRLKSDRGILEAEHLGIKSSEKNPQEGLVNAHADFGEIILETDENEYVYQVKKNGTSVLIPGNGNELFLLTGVLSNDCRVLRQLNDGIDNFNWIVDDLSLAKEYNKCVDALKTKKEDVERMHVLSKRKMSDRKDFRKQLETFRNDLSFIEDQIEKIRSENKKIEKLIEKRKRKHSQLEERKNDARKIKEIITQISKDLEKTKENITVEEKKLKEYQKEYVSIQEIAEMEQILKRFIEEVQEKVTEFQTQRERKQGELNLFLPALNNIRRMNIDQTECPLCETGTIDSKKLFRKIEALRREIDEINGGIKNLLIEKDSKKKEFENKNKKKDFLKEQIRKTKDKLLEVNEEMRGLPPRILVEEDNLKKAEKDILKLERDYEELKKTTEMVDEEASRELSTKEEEKTKINKEIGALEKALKENFIEIMGRPVHPEKAEKILSEWLGILNSAIRHLSKAADEHKREAARTFNRNISMMVQKLGFEELVNIRLNDEYRLYIERMGNSGEGNVIQQIKSLSTSEKLVIALILQSALRNTYLSEIPFFLIDGIIEDFDEDRRKEVIEYLKQLTAEENIIVIATKLNEELPSIKIREV